MNLLLDTHVWLWLNATPERLDPAVAELLGDPATGRVVSAASAWEIAIKYVLGKLPLPEPPHEYIPSRMHLTASTPLPISHEHAAAVASLPRHHRDPFDRLLVAQALAEGLEIVTSDPAFEAYDAPILRAG